MKAHAAPKCTNRTTIDKIDNHHRGQDRANNALQTALRALQDQKKLLAHAMKPHHSKDSNNTLFLDLGPAPCSCDHHPNRRPFLCDSDRRRPPPNPSKLKEKAA